MKGTTIRGLWIFVCKSRGKKGDIEPGRHFAEKGGGGGGAFRLAPRWERKERRSRMSFRRERSDLSLEEGKRKRSSRYLMEKEGGPPVCLSTRERGGKNFRGLSLFLSLGKEEGTDAGEDASFFRPRQRGGEKEVRAEIPKGERGVWAVNTISAVPEKKRRKEQQPGGACRGVAGISENMRGGKKKEGVTCGGSDFSSFRVEQKRGGGEKK